MENFEIGGEFFELTLDGKVVKVRSGPVGSKGKIHKLSYPNPDRAQLEFDKLVAQKRALVAQPAATPVAEPAPHEPAPATEPSPEASPPPAALPTEDPALLLALPAEQRTSLAARPAREGNRNVKKVPFVELHGNRVQGVVSSGSDIERVYVAWVEAGTFNYYCSTNNNRPCGGLTGGSPCQHIMNELLGEALVQFGEGVPTFLKVANDDPNASHRTHLWFSGQRGALTKESAGPVFSRFLSFLSYCELKASPGSCQEMSWFASSPGDPQPVPALPAGVEESTRIIAGLDGCLMRGFARLSSDHYDGLQDLANLYAGTPLSVTAAVEAVQSSEFLAPHFLTLAKARAALLGAQYDALHAQACRDFSLTPVDAPEPPNAPLGPSATLLAGAQQWLLELALAGFEHLEDSSVAPFATLLGQLQARPELTAPAALLTGFFCELLHGEPHSRRWADLWTAAMVGTEHLRGEAPFREVRGTFIPWGLDVQSHENFLNASVYGLLNGERAVRIPCPSWKVDLVSAVDLVRASLLACLEGPWELRVEGELHPHGDFILRGDPTLGGRVNPFDHPVPLLPRVPAWLRHPVHLALPIRKASTLGLLRFDAGSWLLQPLAELTRKGPVLCGHELLKLRQKKKNPTLDLLRERAGRLLRS